MTSAPASPRFVARITGVFYLLTMVAGIFAQAFVSERLVVEGSAGATATNILTHSRVFELGFKPAGRNVSLVAAFLGLAGCVIKTFSRLFYVAPLFILGGAPYLNVFSREQLQALALLFLKVNDRGAGIALAFFGFYAVLTGYLILRSTFLPRFLGVWSVLAGLGWLTFLWPPLGYRLFPVVAGVGFLGALALILWLLVLGVNESRWNEQASAAMIR